MIRALAAEDLPALARALAALPLMVRYGNTPEKLERALSAALGRGEGLLVAEEGGALAGLAWFLTTGTLAMGGYLRLIAVLGAGEGRGTGSALLAAFEAAVARESAHAFLLVSDFNAGAQRFYERHGYRRAGALPGLVLPDVGELLYWKRLR
ncbi:GNAT family N-acetyltransferase [Anaeromyxobacter oryzisoli]|uniref:GNAT family N-acetyltransferase n=1 Tax=Anaeromyxobacter oryzisoli TaxID=2925408 RepID=UPI001F5A7E10|nr:GNAT family N-acetyltransferase [Anaeromyxobacter sp. SG63]